MTQRYMFFNSVPGDTRTYQASDFANYFGNVLSTGVLHIDNVPGLKVKVVAGTLQTVVEYGGSIMRGHLYENTEDEFLTHSLPESSLDRIDRIVLRLDSRNSERNILLHIKEGNPASSPVPPVLQRDNFIHELSLAQIRVRANTSSLQSSDLKDERMDKELCGLVFSLLGNSELERQFNAHLAHMEQQLEGKSDKITPDLYTLPIPAGFTTGNGNITYFKNQENLVTLIIKVRKDSDFTSGSQTLGTLPVGYKPITDALAAGLMYATSGSLIANSLFTILITPVGAIVAYCMPGGTFTNARDIRHLTLSFYAKET